MSSTSSTPAPHACGRCDARFRPLQDRFEQALAAGEEAGAALAVVCDGELVVDLWGGAADSRSRQPWAEDTLVNLFSVTKGLVALSVLQMVQRDLLALDAPLQNHWPECSGEGRETITLSDALSHRAGLIGFRPGAAVDPELMLDFAGFAAAVVAQPPFWTPGTRHGYHARTFGHLLGWPALQASGVSLGGWLREHVAGPLGLDLHLGVPEAEQARCATLEPGRLPARMPADAERLMQAMSDPQSFTGAAFSLPPTPRGFANSAAFRSAEIPALNGHGTARDLARLYGDLADPAPQLLDASLRDEALRPRSDGDDPVLLRPTRFGLGFMLARDDMPLGGGPRAFGHPGAGGSLAFADPDARLGFAFVMNRLQPAVVAGSALARDLAALARDCALQVRP